MSLSRAEYTRRAAITIGLAVVAFSLVVLFWLTAAVWLIVFAGVLLAVFLDGLARLVGDHTPLPRKAGLALVVVVLLGLGVGAGWLIGPQVADQGSQLSEELPKALDTFEDWVRDLPAGSQVAAQIPDSPQSLLASGSPGFGQLRSAFSTALGIFANLLIIVFVGLYLALHPGRYVDALAHLVSQRHRDHARGVIGSAVKALRYWLLGRIASMLVVGLLTAIGLMVFGIPLALALGLIAALFSFIPYIGPILAIVPALLVALGEGSNALVTVLAIYIAVQFLESYLITPVIQDRAVSMPPALLITAQVVLGVLAGAFGVAVATPLAVVAIVLVQMLYVEDALGDDVDVLGEQHG